MRTTRGFLLYWNQNIYSSTNRLSTSVPAERTYPTVGIYSQLSIFDQQQFRAEVTQTISTAESPERHEQPISCIKVSSDENPQCELDSCMA